MKQETKRIHKNTSEYIDKSSLEKGLDEIPNDRGDRFSKAIKLALSDFANKIKEGIQEYPRITDSQKDTLKKMVDVFLEKEARLK